MSVLNLLPNTEYQGQTTPELSALPSTNTERFSAAWSAAQTDDRYWNVQAARKGKADKIIDDLHAMTGERLRNPYDNAPTTDEIRENLGQPTTVIYAKRLEALREKTRNAKAGIEQLGGLPQDYLDVDSIDADIASQSGAARARDERMSGTGGGFGGFLGTMAGETVSPHGIMTSFIPVTRMGGAVAEAGVAAFARNVAKDALFQGGTQGAAQSLATIVDFNTRKQFGTEQTNEQILEEIISAGAGGALLGGSFRAIHLGILKLASRGVEIPPAALDSARVMEERDLYGNKNPLRVAPAASEIATDQATSAAALGRAASPNVDVPVLAHRPDFNEWQKTNKLVGAGGQPVMAYHGTTQTFERFDPARQGSGAGLGKGESGFFFGGTPEMANEFAGKLGEGHVSGGQVRPAYLRMENPKIIEDTGEGVRTVNFGREIAAAKAEGHDGIVIRNTVEGGDVKGDSYVVFDEKNIRNFDERYAAPDGSTVPAAEAEKAVADARLQGAAAETLTLEQQHKQAAALELAQREGLTEDIRTSLARGETPEQISERLGGRLTEDEVAAVGKSLETPAAPAASEQVDPELQRLVKSIDEHPDNPMQAPRPPPPEPQARPTEAKPAGESAEDKAVLQQAQQILDNETLAKIDPEARRKLELLEIEEREHKAAVACVAGVI